MKKSTVIMAIALAVLGIMTIMTEIDCVTYQRATCAMVMGAKKNGAITPDQYEAMYALADRWHPHAFVRRERCERVRRMVRQAYQEQREREENEPKVYQAISQTMESYRTIKVEE